MKKTNKHRFIDEAGDLTFCDSKGNFIIGTNGVSKTFSIGMLRLNGNLDEIRNTVSLMQQEIENDVYLNVIPSVKKRTDSGGFFFHCKDDVPEIRMIFNRYIKTLDCSFEMRVARKLERFYNDGNHNHKDEKRFYADVLSHLLKNHLQKEPELVLNIADRGKTTANNVLS